MFRWPRRFILALLCFLLTMPVHAGFQRVTGPHTIPERIDTSDIPIVANVRDFGAVGDGVTDDTAAIARALGAATRAKGGVVFFPAGTYLVTGRILPRTISPLTIMGDGVVLRGEGPDATRILAQFPENTSTTAVIRAEGRRTGTATYLTADAKAGDRALVVGDAAERFSPGDHIILEADDTGPLMTPSRLPFYRGRNHLLIVDRVDGDTVYVTEPLRLDFLTADRARITQYEPIRRVVIEDLSIHSTNEADLNLVHFSYAYQCQMTNVHLSGFTRGGLRLDWSKGCVIADNDSSHARWFGGGGEGYGFNMHRSHDNLFERNHSTVTRHAFVVNYGNSGNLLRNNVMSHSTLAAIDIHGEYNYDNHVLENEISNAGDMGIVVGGGGSTVHYNDGPGNVIERNTIVDSDRGVAVRDETHDTFVIGNIIRNTRRDGILVIGPSHRVVIAGNYIEMPRTYGIYVHGDEATIKGNTIRFLLSGVHGIYVHPESSGFHIENNILGGSRLTYPKDQAGTVGENE